MPVFTWKSGAPNETDTGPPEIAEDPVTVTEKVEPEVLPDETWTKADLLAWCEEHDIDVPDYWTKREILELIEEELNEHPS